MLLVVGRVGRAHGVRGDVFVEPFTDEPDERFAAGAVLHTPGEAQLTVVASKWHSGKLVVHFVGIDDRTAAESIRGTELTLDVDPEARPTDPDEFYDHQLVGLRALLADGTLVGQVAEVIHLPAQDLLALRRTDGGEALIPFVHAIVPTVDLAAGTVTLAPPPGLLDLADAQDAEPDGDQ